MRRRRFVASGVTVLAALAGCLGSDPQGERESGASERSRTNWEPAASGSGDRESRDEGATNRTGSGSRNAEEGADGSGGSNGKRDRDGDGGSGGNEASEAFENGATWEAERAQVAADARKASTAVDFELETAPPESCGRTCRELRAALTNTGSGDAHDVVVYTELASGGTTLRERRDVVGDLSAGETYRATERVELGAIEAIQVKRNGALVVEHVVTADERREVFEKRVET